MPHILQLLIITCTAALCWGRIHNLHISNDIRKYIALSTFGFYKGGLLDVQLQSFIARPVKKGDVFGFSLDRTLNDAMNPYLDAHQDRCLLQQKFPTEHDAALIYFILDLNNKTMQVNCSPEWQQPVHIYKNLNDIPITNPKPDFLGDTNLLQRFTRDVVGTSPDPCGKLVLDVTSFTKGNLTYYNTSIELYTTANSRISFYMALGFSDLEEKEPCHSKVSKCRFRRVSGIPKDPHRLFVPAEKLDYATIHKFVLYVASDSEEGLYNLYFHSCPNYVLEREVTYDFSMVIVEENAGGSFLSAGEMPLPALYCTMAVLFFLSGCFWVFLLKQSRHPVFKIHYLMATLVFLKAVTLAFHGVNYHFIEIRGVHLATWAVLFYIAHLLKGALLFITLVLIGTGWTFIKHVLAPRDKRLFMAIIPLQVLANVAEIILEESEEGAREHRAWQDVFILVDLLCCGCIMFPVVWSIRHLQEASQTDGKAAVNLRKLKLFRHFYVMVVCYIYFTRIIVSLLRMTVPFQYGWLHEMFHEMATYVFFVLTGYKFRPAAHNPYFALPSDDDDEEDEVLTESGLTEGLNRVNSRSKYSKHNEVTEVKEEEKDSLLAKKESSHEYD